MPAPKIRPQKTVPVFNLELLEARRRIAVLEAERSAANLAVNDLVIRSWELERTLTETAGMLAAVDRRFLEHVDADIARVRAENEALHARLHALETNRWWKMEMRVRRAAAGLLKRVRGR